MNNGFRVYFLLVTSPSNSKLSMNTVKLFARIYLYIRLFLKQDSSQWSNIHSIVKDVVVFICLVIDIQMTLSRRVLCYVRHLCEYSYKRFCIKCLGSLSILSW